MTLLSPFRDARTRRRCRAAAAMALLLAGSLFAQPAPREDADLKKVKTDIARMKRKLERVRSETRTTEQELEAIELELAIHTRELQIAVGVQNELERDQRATEAEIERLTGAIARQKQFLATRMAALYRLGQLSYLRLALAMNASENPFEAASMLAYLIGRDARAVEQYQATRARLDARNLELVARRTEIVQAQQVVTERRSAVQKSRQEKTTLLARLRTESTTSARALSELEEKARRLEALFKLLYERSGEGDSGVARIADFKGALEWPVRGSVLESFGKRRSEKFATFTASNGIRIGADPGTDVRAVFQGTVLYAQWFKGYGNLVIVDHGERVFSLYGNTRNVSVAAGERIEPGQSIAMVSEGEDGTAGHLYFEIREDNRPTDPEAWLR